MQHTVTVDVDVYVDDVIDDLSDQDLIDILDVRGYDVISRKNPQKVPDNRDELEDEHIDWICDMIIGLDLERDPIPGRVLDLLRKR